MAYTKEDVLRLAQLFDHYKGDTQALVYELTRMGAFPDGFFESGTPDAHEYLLRLQGARLWYESAYPSVAMGHRYAAMLISTRVTPDVRAMARLPWPAVWIEIPKGLLDIPEENLTPFGVLVWEGYGGWRMWCPMGRYGMCGNVEGTETRPPARSESEEWESSYIREGTPEGRVKGAVSRLIINSCLAMSDPTNIRNLPPGSGGSLRNSKEPTSYTYQLGKPPNVDCRPALQEYLRGTRKGASPTVQTLVAGHWKPKLGERVGRPVYVEPYWRGPEDAPIKVQQKVLEPPTP